ncbi:sugar kinase [Paenibacillus sp. TRM 82003]|nr:sugar kinase [Kineococcus sp. TRM81007]MCI2239477.1 sugar kinase [Kineococcus sp. TRM81007]MCI3919277.1 sugar kinase [Paenibacillus sp. TRM 82003]
MSAGPASAGLRLRAAGECRFDAVALGEVMLRLDPGEGRIRTARSFRVWEGGGEYNVVRGLRRTFGHRTAIATALVDNEVGRLVEDLVLTGGVDTSLVRWVPFDGVGREARNGLNFTERGFGLRGAVGVSDRGHTAASQLRPGDVDAEHLFGELGVRWLHTGGVFAALSESARATALEFVRAARRHGTVVSYDLNYRPSLWRALRERPAELEAAWAANREIVREVDVLLGHEGHLAAVLGFEAASAGDGPHELGPAELTGKFERLAGEFPRLAVVATTRRTVRSATRNDWGGVAWSPATGLLRSVFREDVEVLDRIGGGDSFASGLVHGLLRGEDLATALEYGAAHGALAMTTPGDATMATEAEVLALAAGGRSGVDR